MPELKSEHSITITIDGPAGSGKSSTATRVAESLGILHLDTGAMYRAVTLKCLRNAIPHRDRGKIAELLKDTDISFTGAPGTMRVWMDGEDVSAAIRSDEVTKNVSDYCAVPIVRAALVGLQRKMGSGQSVVCEGRDIGTVVFPKAQLKFYMVASEEERAKRRQKDFAAMGIHKGVSELVAELRERDRKDSTRDDSPLCKAEDAEEIDTTNTTLDQQVRHIVDKAKKLMQNPVRGAIVS